MEAVASTTGYGFCFHPSDESLVVNFLLPRNLGNDVTESSPIIDDDPYRIEPWNLLAAHEKDVEEGAYFLAKKVKLGSKGLRRKRTVSNTGKILGTWRIQHSTTHWAPVDMTVGWGWSKTLLSYYSTYDSSRTTGYVMHEYELLENGTGGGSKGLRKGETYKYVICHVKLSDREISRSKRRRTESAAASATSGSNTGSYETTPQQQPPPALPAAVEGIAEPPLDCNGEADMEMNIDEVVALLDEGALKEQPQMQQLPLNAFNDNYSNFSNFYIDNGRNDVFADNYSNDASFGLGRTNNSNFYQASVVLPTSDPHSAPSPALSSSPWPGIPPQPDAAFEVPLVAASNVDAAALAAVRHEFLSDDYFSSYNTFDYSDSY